MKTAEEGWGQISNGELISCAERARYEILITCDQNVRYHNRIIHWKVNNPTLCPPAPATRLINSNIGQSDRADQRDSPDAYILGVEFLMLVPPCRPILNE